MNKGNPVLEQELSAWAKTAFEAAFGPACLDGLDTYVVPTANPSFGDYQCNAAMVCAKRLRKRPRDVADAVLPHLSSAPFFGRCEVAGPGFINFFLDDGWLAQRLVSMSKSERLDVPMLGYGKKLIIDYSSPNIAKPMHIGHIRSTVLGNALARLFRFLGYSVTTDNHLGDWGTQFGLLLLGYRRFLDTDALQRNPIEECERIYIASYERSKEDGHWLEEARAELVKLQQGDAENERLWKEIVALSLEEFDRMYQRLDIRFDLVRGESFYRDRLEGMVAALVKQKLAHQSEGAWVVSLEEEGLPVCLVQKSDGGYNYLTSDLATIESRVAEFEPDSIIYVTDERQQLHFQQLFSVAKKMGYSVDLQHIWFGLMRLPEGTFSTREGNVIRLRTWLDEAEQRALEMVQKTSPDMEELRQREVARAVGIGAVKYADLSQNPRNTITFTWEKALSLEGNSAPYLQYAYARICSVLDKYETQFPGVDLASYPIRIGVEVERSLALLLIRFSDTLEKAARHYRPNLLAEYLYDLAQTYSTFYQTTPFLKAEEGVRESRLRLCSLVAQVLRQGLDLLGIDTPERI